MLPPRIVTILDRLRQDLADDLTPDAIKLACNEEKYSWRERLLNPVTTVYLFILQILHGNTACQHAVHFGGWNFTDSAYCAARKRLPLGVLHRLMGRVAQTCRTAGDASTWFGHRVWLLDGSSFSMSDTPELQATFGQPGGQRRGCGFPVAKFLALFDLATGMLLRVEEAPLRSHEMSRCAVVAPTCRPATLSSGTAAFAHSLILRFYSTASCTGCSALTRSKSSTSPQVGRRRRSRRGRGRGRRRPRCACRTRGGWRRKASGIKSLSGTSRNLSHEG